MNKLRNRCIGVMGVGLLMSILITSNAFAEETTVDHIKKLPLDFEYSSEKVSVSEAMNEEGQLEIAMQDAEEGAYLYMHQNLASYTDVNGVYFHIQNPSDQKLYLDVMFYFEDSTSVTLDSDINSFYKYDAEAHYRVLNIANDMLEIPSEFVGSIYIPYTVWEHPNKKSNVELNELNSAVGLGITISTPVVKEQLVTIDTVALLEENGIADFEGMESSQLKLIERIPIPVMGESMEVCSLVDVEEPSDVVYSIAYSGEDVSITEEGCITVREGATDQIAVVSAVLEDEYILETSVQLDSTWQQYETDENGKKYYIQSVDEYENLNNIEHALALRSFVIPVRIILIMILGFITTTYVYWKLKKKKQDKGEN